jgi:acyl-homoserine lactone acylase PvdQ
VALTRADLVAAVPDTTHTARLSGLGGRADVWRDPQGIPHVRADSAGDAFLAQGFVHAQDQLWQTDYMDQADDSAEGRLHPMRYDWARIRAEAESQQALEPEHSPRR